VERKTVSFYGSATARGIVTLASTRIQRPFTVKEIHATFPVGTLNLLLLRFYLSGDAHAPTTGLPSGTSLLQDYGQVDYLTGDGTRKVTDHEVGVETGGHYLKVHATNNDWYAHAIDVQIIIETP